VLVNDDLLIDLGPDIVSAANRFGLYLGGLRTVLITHRHSDHWLPDNLNWREPGFAATPVEPLTVYGPQDALLAIEPHLARGTELSAHAVTAGERWRAGSYVVTAVPATHGGGTLEPLLYVVDDGTHCLFYATDTSSLGKGAWDILGPLGAVDVILLDETSGLSSGGEGHHGFQRFLATRAQMIDSGLLGPGSALYAHHFSHNGKLTHKALVERFAPYSVSVTYDGMTIAL
jgi:phosphoribosyl 1,2-cyclic phosphate phosphodiesterase